MVKLLQINCIFLEAFMRGKQRIIFFVRKGWNFHRHVEFHIAIPHKLLAVYIITLLMAHNSHSCNRSLAKGVHRNGSLRLVQGMASSTRQPPIHLRSKMEKWMVKTNFQQKFEKSGFSYSKLICTSNHMFLRVIWEKINPRFLTKF